MLLYEGNLSGHSLTLIQQSATTSGREQQKPTKSQQKI